MVTNQKDSERKVEFNLDYRDKKYRKFRELDKKEESFFQKKLKEFGKLSIAQFEQNKARPRIWNGKWPGTPPLTLSEDILNKPLYRINFGRKMRVFAIRNAPEKNNEFLVIWVDATHKSG